jgi:ABC-type transporter Mla maintaining outer membrane lipid asymmetry ATPase subunit MlaF
MPVRLEVDAVCWSAGGFPLLRGVSFTAEPGDILMIGGRSGSGRSTLLEICAGLKQPLSGRILWDAVDIATMSRTALLAAREHIGFLFQRHALIANYSIYENIALPLRTQGSRTEREVDLRVRAVMEEVALFGVERMFPERLSTGQLRSAALARALATDPDILFLDEPLCGLDPQTAAGIRSVLVDEQRRKRRTVIAVGHDPGVWSPLAVREMILEDGRLRSPETAAACAENPEVAG